MRSVEDMTAEELSRVLTYAGFILVAFELVKDSAFYKGQFQPA